jgi:hypothetical protein
MTLADSNLTAGPFAGTGVLLSYTFTFKVFSAADLAVSLLNTATNVVTAGVLGSSFLATLNADQDANPGGSVQYAVAGVATALPVGTSLTITPGATTYTQNTDLPQAGNYDPEVVEDALDRVVRLIQLLRAALAVAVAPPIVDLYQLSCSDLETSLVAANNVGYFRAVYAGTIVGVRASLLTVSSSGLVTVDMNVNGSTRLSTKLTIDASEKTSVTAATPHVVSNTALAVDDEVAFDIDTAGTGAKGLIVTVLVQRA